MGNILNLSPDQLDDQGSQLRIVLDLARPVSHHVKQLLFWSLEEIRNIYAPFRKRKSSPVLTRSEFLRFLRLSRISAFHIYDELCRTEQINAFEVMAMLVLTAFTTTSYKIQFMFNVFDLLSIKTLKFADLILMFKSVVRGYAYLTTQPLPDVQLLEKYAQTVFSRADLNNDQNLELSEILTWVDENRDATDLFRRFEPKVHGKEEYHIFNGFAPYRQEEIEILLARIRKVHYKEKLDNEDYQLLRTSDRLPKALPKDRERDKENQRQKENTFALTSPAPEQSIAKGKYARTSFKLRTENSSLHGSKSGSALVFKEKINSIKLPMCGGSLNCSTVCEESGRKTRFSNIIIIKGRTITKREIFDLRDYFDKLSGGKECILIQDFIESFSQEKYNHMKSVAASLYNFLDHDQNGRVSFKELLLKIYPNLTPLHILTIDKWTDEYNLNFNVRSKVKPPRRQDETKKRVLPKACLPRFQEMFAFYDRTRKGYIDLEDMRKVLSEVCSEREIAELFEDSDRDGDGRLSLVEFANVILPMDLEIEGLQ